MRTGPSVSALHEIHFTRINFGRILFFNAFSFIDRKLVNRAAVGAGDKIPFAETEQGNEEKGKLLKGTDNRRHRSGC